MKLKNALAEISPDDRQKEKMFCAVEKSLRLSRTERTQR